MEITELNATHIALGARMVEFAGFHMPVQYEGVLAEHNWTRASCGLFDVSHMGQVYLHGDSFENVAKALETLVPADILGLVKGQQRYSQFLNEKGGTLDDLMITRPAHIENALFLVVNAGCKYADVAHMIKHLPQDVKVETDFEQGLLALQGVKAEAVFSKLVKGVETLTFMQAGVFKWGEVDLHVSRTGYTGEDGYEISVPKEHTVALWNALLQDERVKPVGLGARDSLRLEAGLCLYGHELNEEISPIEAALLWSIQKRRRENGGFLGAKRVLSEIAIGATRKLVAFDIEGKAPVREGSEIHKNGVKIGFVSSGGFSPTLGKPIAIGFVEKAFSTIDTPVELMVRGKAIAAKVVKMPFVAHRYKRG